MVGICLAVLAGLTGLACGESADPAPPRVQADGLEVRVLGAGARVVLIRDGKLLASAQIRPVGPPELASAPLVKAAEPWNKAALLTANAEAPRQLEFPAPGGGTLSVLLQIRRVDGGARVLVSPALARSLEPPADPPAAGPPGAGPRPLPWELCVELYPALQKNAQGAESRSWPELTAVDAAGTIARPLKDERLPRPGGKPFRATRLSFDAPGLPRVEVSRSAPVTWTLVRNPEALQLRQALLPAAREPERPGAFLFFLGGARDTGAPEFSPLTFDKRQVPAWDFVEGAVRVFAGGADPYGYEELKVFAEIACPAEGRQEEDAVPRMLHLPCFFREGPPGSPAEGEFRFRFAPPAEGTYAVRVKAVAPGGVVQGQALALRAGPPASRGFVKVKAGERVLRFDDGGVFFPLGLNLAWPAAKNDADGFRTRLAALARHGGNAARVWLSSWGLPLEAAHGARFDPETADALDRIFTSAQAREIGLILVLENAHDLTANSKTHPYFRESGGPLLASAEFFREAEALKRFKTRATYVLARYGAFRSALAWELLNEADEVWPVLKADPADPRTLPAAADRARAARRDVLAWTAQLAEHVRAMDLHGRPICLSLALPPETPWVEMEKVAGLSLLQMHGYLPEAADARDDRDFDEVASIAAWAAAARASGSPQKPNFLGEFGYRALDDAQRQKGGPAAVEDDRNTRDREGLLLHNALFAGLATGMAGAPMSWWWDRYVERHQLWKIFKGPAAFARALEELATREGPGKLRLLNNELELVTDKAKSVRVLGRMGRQGACIWIHDRRSTWAASLERNEPAPPEVKGLEVRLPALESGTYNVRWLQTWAGTELPSESLVIAASGPGVREIELRCPPFVRDLALVIEQAK